MANDIQIGSNALLLIGDQPIQEWADSDGGIACQKFYQECKEFVLGTHPWTFAMKILELSQNSEAPSTYIKYTHSHKLPADRIRIHRMLPDGMDYIIHGTNILSYYESVAAEYTYDCDESLLSLSCQLALEYCLAGKLANSITEDKKKAADMEERFRFYLGIAQNNDCTQQPQQPIYDAPFNRVRNGGSGRGFFSG